ncbi:MAG: hypothetical protein OEZ06_12290 [Myxococcales bacterium]|nr:hypothetical protein [Myxococcales bacterium]
MTRRLPVSSALFIAAALCLGAGCRGCTETPGADAPLPTPARAEEGDRARIEARLRARKVDRSRSYPKDARGRIACGSDIDCFILQVEACAPAVLIHDQTVVTYGIEQRIVARYFVLGNEGELCRVARERLRAEAILRPELVAALQKKGKTSADLQKMQREAMTLVERKNPPRLDCALSPLVALDTILDLAQGRYNPVVWRQHCAEGTPSGEPMPDAGTKRDASAAAPQPEGQLPPAKAADETR